MCVPGCQEALQAGLSRRRFFKGAAAASFVAVAASEPADAVPRRFTRTVDLTHTMSPDFPTFFGVPGIELEKKFDLKKDGFYDKLLDQYGVLKIDEPAFAIKGPGPA